MRPQKLTHYSFRDAAHGYVAALYFEGHQAFSSGPFKGVEQHKRRKLSSSRSSDDLRAGRHQATRIKACPRTRSDVVATVLGVPRKKRCPTTSSNNDMRACTRCVNGLHWYLSPSQKSASS